MGRSTPSSSRSSPHRSDATRRATGRERERTHGRSVPMLGPITGGVLVHHQDAVAACGQIADCNSGAVVLHVRGNRDCAAVAREAAVCHLDRPNGPRSRIEARSATHARTRPKRRAISMCIVGGSSPWVSVGTQSTQASEARAASGDSPARHRFACPSPDSRRPRFGAPNSRGPAQVGSLRDGVIFPTARTGYDQIERRVEIPPASNAEPIDRAKAPFR